MNLAAYYRRALRDAFGDDATDEPLLHSPDDSEVDASDSAAADNDQREYGLSETDPRVARGDSLLDDGDGAKIKSVLPGVDDDHWTQFVRCMVVAPLSAVSPSNGVGMFEIMPRRLADLGLVTTLRRRPSPTKRTIWVAAFVPPLTADRFLRSPSIQYRTFAQSMRNYAGRIRAGKIEKSPEMTLSGALAILHRAGPSGLKTWETAERFPATESVYTRVAGVF